MEASSEEITLEGAELSWPREFALAFYEMSFLLPHFLKEGRAKLAMYCSAPPESSHKLMFDEPAAHNVVANRSPCFSNATLSTGCRNPIQRAAWVS